MQFKLQAKILALTIGVPVVLTAAALLVVHQRVNEQLEHDASLQLDNAERVFQHYQRQRAAQLLAHYGSLGNDSHWQSMLSHADAPALQTAAKELLREDAEAGVVLLVGSDGRRLAMAERDAKVDAARFTERCENAARRALAGIQKVDTIQVEGRVFTLAALPIRNGAAWPAGVVIIGTEIGEDFAQQVKQFTHSDVVLVADHQVAGASLPAAPMYPELITRFDQLSALDPLAARDPVHQIINREHFLCRAIPFATLDHNERLGYLVLSSYEMPRRVLYYTQLMLAALGLLGAFVGSLAAWWVVRRFLQPLGAMRQTVEAVGEGNFTLQAPEAPDECGELSHALNRMTAHLRASRDELETTITNLRQTQERTIQAEKLAGIGEFVSGVAHELNNPLTSALGFAELLQQTELAEPQRRFLDMTFKSAKRCQKVVQSLLSFARRHAPERKVVSVNQVLESAVDILQAELREANIELTTQLDSDLPPCQLDTHQMQQVFLHLINNARQAIQANNQPFGSLRITSERVGARARVTFQDNGPGIKPEHIRRIFNPFFTTREVGKGTGLGLSYCYGVITEHGGTITPFSAPGEGATFVVDLPFTEEAVARIVQSEPAHRLAPAREGVGRRVLVIDDEDAILNVIQQALTAQGYKVDVARDGETALRRLGQYRYDLALCDWKMPDLTGQDVYERLREVDPEMSRRLIFITGGAVTETAQQFLQEADKVCLSKPFTLTEFRAAIGRLLTPVQA